jgi:ribose 5-phosphate isomerase B
MRIAIGSDHAGYLLKEELKPRLQTMGHELIDVGTDSEKSTDYPEFGAAAAQMVADGHADRGIVICGSGVGMCMIANKIPGIRAVNAHDADEALMSRHHNDANVLALAGRRLNRMSAMAICELWLETDFEGDRHERRLEQMAEIEQGVHS